MRTDESYEARVARTLAELGIPTSYGVDRHMPFYAEAKELGHRGLAHSFAFAAIVATLGTWAFFDASRWRDVRGR